MRKLEALPPDEAVLRMAEANGKNDTNHGGQR